MSSPTGDPPSEDISDVDLDEVRRTDNVVEDVRSGAPAEWFTGQPGAALAAWRDSVNAGPPPLTDPAIASLPDTRYDDPRFNPIAFLPVDGPQAWDAGEVSVMPSAPLGDTDERADGWCEDRSPDLGEITCNDGED